MHLRVCRTCGHIGCCDSSPNRHATKHAQATSHPIITSVEPGEYWSYCYPDDKMLMLDASSPRLATVHERCLSARGHAMRREDGLGVALTGRRRVGTASSILRRSDGCASTALSTAARLRR